MNKISVKLNSPEKIWEKDKKLLSKKYGSLPIDWQGSLPTTHEDKIVRELVAALWINPDSLAELTKEFVDKCVEENINLIETKWNQKFNEKPIVEVIPPDNYLSRVQQLNKELGDLVNYPLHIKSPPSMAHLPYFRTILIPERFPFRIVPDGQDILDMKQLPISVHYFPWNNNFFNLALTEELSHSLFRQVRGEWGEDYIKILKKVGLETMGFSVETNENIAQITREQITKTEKPEWGLYTVLEKFNLAWRSERNLALYSALQALTRAKSIRQASLIDSIGTNGEDYVSYDFDKNHPYYESKRKIFDGK